MKPMNQIKKTTVICVVIFAISPMAMAQIPGGALEKMLQRPKVTKYYPGKRFGDHLFVDAGAGINLAGLPGPEVTATGELHVGDWISPEHGIRLNVSGGFFRAHGVKTKYIGGGLDYLLNITALAQPGLNYTPKDFEVYGLIGVDFLHSRNDVRHNEYGLGAHVGLRGQVALSPFTYFYVEPRIGLIEDDVAQVSTWHGYHPYGSASVGFGYRLPERGRRMKDRDSLQVKNFANGMFISISGGPIFVANTKLSKWGDSDGMRLAASIGKWFGHYNGLRLTFNGTTFLQNNDNRVKAIGAQAEYMLNMHNAFGGINPDRVFWINALAGISYNYTVDNDHKHRSVFGYGGGLQANFRLSRDIDFFLEPRVEIFNKYYAPKITSIKNMDIMPSLQAGLSYTYHDRSATQAPADEFVQKSWQDHSFVETGIGANISFTKSSVRDPFGYMRPLAYVGVGKWFSPVSGARLWAQAAQTQCFDLAASRYKHIDFGMDYMLNFTNAFYGYRVYRPLEFIGTVGANLSKRQNKDNLFFGLDASLRAVWNVSRAVGLFIEPRLQGYGDDYLPTAFSTTKLDFITSLSAGVQFNLRAADRATGDAAGNDEVLRSSFTFSGGFANTLDRMNMGDYYAPIGKLSYTHWYSPTTAWRLNGQGLMRRKLENKRYAQISAGADIMKDITAYTYGYDPSRALSASVFAGANLGVDFGGGRTTFSPDLHIGGQLSVRVTDAFHITAEPQMAYLLSSRFSSSTMGRWMPQMLVGLEYSLKRTGSNKNLSGTPERQNIIEASIGTGVYTGSFANMSPLGRKLTFLSTIGYGRWINEVSGVHASLDNTVVQRHDKNSNITSIHADYMMNIKSAVTGESTSDDLFQLTGLAGVSFNINSHDGHRTRFAPGLKAAMQLGCNVTKTVEIFFEPSATVYTRSIDTGNASHPVDGELKVSLGTKFHF